MSTSNLAALENRAIHSDRRRRQHGSTSRLQMKPQTRRTPMYKRYQRYRGGILAITRNYHTSQYEDAILCKRKRRRKWTTIISNFALTYDTSTQRVFPTSCFHFKQKSLNKTTKQTNLTQPLRCRQTIKFQLVRGSDGKCCPNFCPCNDVEVADRNDGNDAGCRWRWHAQWMYTTNEPLTT